MSTPFPLEQADQENRVEGVWDPWHGPSKPGFFSGFEPNQDNAYLGPIYRALQGAGSAAAKGELVAAGAWGAVAGGLDRLTEAGKEALGTQDGQPSPFKSVADTAEDIKADARARIKALTPDPATNGAASNILHGLTSVGSEAVVGAGLGAGVGAATLVGGLESGTSYSESREAGIPAGPAALRAAVTGAFSAAGVTVPFAYGNSLLSKMATAGATNVLFGAAQRGTDHLILEHAGFHDMAEQQKVLDGTQILSDALLGTFLFGPLAHLHAPPPELKAAVDRLRNTDGAEDAARVTSLTTADRASAPGIPATPGAAGAHQRALESALESLATGDPVDVSGAGLEGQPFVPRPEADPSDVLSLFAAHLHEAGLVDEVGRLDELERALAGKRSGEAPESPHVDLTVHDVADNVRQQLDEVGRFGPQENEHYSRLVGAFYDTLGKRLGISPEEALQRYPLKVSGEGEPVQAEAAFGQSAQPAFYSSAVRAVENLRGESASPEQWLATLKNLKGVKPEELDWMGVNDWLAKQKGQVTREALLQHMRKNAVQLQEVTKGASSDEGIQHVHDQLRAMGWRLEENVHGDPALEPNPELFAKHQAKVDEFLARVDEKYGRHLGPQDMRDGTLNDAEQAEWDRLVKEGEATATPPVEAEALLREVARGEVNRPQYEQYQTPGGENYREMLLTLPQRGFDADFRGGHWEEPNVLAHVRFNDRTGPNGEKILHVEEIQSDWHQRGRKQGYQDERGTMEQEKSEYEALRRERIALRDDDTPEGRRRFQEVFAQMNVLEAKLKRADAVPNAPFKKTWPELALKRMVRFAAEHGYDELTWTTGEQQAARYDLSKQISALHVGRMKDGNYSIGADTGNGPRDLGTGIKAEELERYVGKDLAKRITENKDERQEYDGLDLKIGGEGMRGFYDSILPKAADKLFGKYGAKVGTEDIGVRDRKFEGEQETPPGRPVGVRQLHNGMWTLDLDSGDVAAGWGMWSTKAEAEAALPRFQAKYSETAQPVHALKITPELRDAALAGQPLFQPERGRYQPDARTITLLAGADRSTFLHESGHHFLDVTMHAAMEPGAPHGMEEDANTLLRWFGVGAENGLTALERWHGMSLDQQRGFHEKFARGFERYLAEGSAPTKALQGVFDRFKEWLANIYRSMRDLNVEITPEVRGVMDRMLAENPELARGADTRPTHEEAAVAPTGEPKPVPEFAALPKRNIRTPDPTHDSILQYLAKTRRGLDIDEAVSQGIDREDIAKNPAAFVGIKRAFRKGGMSFDEAAEALHDSGYPVQDDAGRYDPNVLLGHIDSELRGRPVHSERNTRAALERDAAEAHATAVRAEFEDKVPEFKEAPPPMADMAVVAEQARRYDEEATERALERPGSDADILTELRGIVERGRVESERASAAAEQQRAGRAGALAQAGRGAGGGDLFGHDTGSAQRLADAQRAKDARRNTGQESLETGRPDDLFSQARHQVDLTDQIARERPDLELPDGRKAVDAVREADQALKTGEKELPVATQAAAICGGRKGFA